MQCAAPGQELNEGHQEVATLLEQTALLTAQAINSLAFKHRMNILSKLILNFIKATEILNEQSLILRCIWKHLFQEKLEEKISKVTYSKQNSKTKFTGLHKSSTPRFYNSPHTSQAGPVPKNKKQGAGGRGRGNLLFQRAAFRKGIIL